MINSTRHPRKGHQRHLNRFHYWFCRTARWRKTIQQRIPWALEGLDLGANILELGPGPGLSTDFLRKRVDCLTAVEIDTYLAESLQSRLGGANVQVVTGDATALPFPGRHFSGGVSFTMLHHVPSLEMQDQLLQEVCRVLKPGGIFAGADSRQSVFMRLIHLGDTLVPIDPRTFGGRLEAAGFEVLTIDIGKRAFRFQARRPWSTDSRNREN